MLFEHHRAKIGVSSDDADYLPCLFGMFHTFADLTAALEKLPDQRDCGPVEPAPGFWFEEISVHHVMPKSDENQAFSEMLVASEVAAKIQEILHREDGDICWRERLETKHFPIRFVDRYTPDGEHRDYRHDMRYAARPGEYVVVKAYCRLVRIPKSASKKAAA